MSIHGQASEEARAAVLPPAFTARHLVLEPVAELDDPASTILRLVSSGTASCPKRNARGLVRRGKSRFVEKRRDGEDGLGSFHTLQPVHPGAYSLRRTPVTCQSSRDLKTPPEQWYLPS